MVSRSALRSRTRRAKVAEVAAFNCIPRSAFLQSRTPARTVPDTELAGPLAAVQGPCNADEKHVQESQEATDEVKKLTASRDQLTESLAAKDAEVEELKKSSTSKIMDLEAANEKLQVAQTRRGEQAQRIQDLQADVNMFWFEGCRRRTRSCK